MDNNLFFNVLCRIVQLITRIFMSCDIYDSSHFVSVICTCQLSLMVIVVLGIQMPLTWFLFYIFAIYTAEKINFPIKDFFSKCDQIHRKLQIWSHLLKKSLMEKFIFCAVIPYNHFSGPYFPTFGPNKEIYPVNLCI